MGCLFYSFVFSQGVWFFCSVPRFPSFLTVSFYVTCLSWDSLWRQGWSICLHILVLELKAWPTTPGNFLFSEFSLLIFVSSFINFMVICCFVFLILLFEIGFHVSLESLKIIVLTRMILNFCSSCFPLWVLGLHKNTTAPSFCSDEAQTQNFAHDRQATLLTAAFSVFCASGIFLILLFVLVFSSYICWIFFPCEKRYHVGTDKLRE